MTFRELGLIEPILGALAELGYERPSPIQEKAIPPALTGRDVLGCAQTGTGKTCAFATPILQRLNAGAVQGRPIRALILTPTRELALQIQESFEAYGKRLKLRSTVIFGGVGQAPQVERLRRGVDILVATPGRLADLYQQKLLDFSGLEIFVLDEADRMLDMGFIHDVKKILKWLPQRKQTLFFSATMPAEITELVDSLLHDPVRVAVDPVSSPVEVIDQKLYYVDRGNKTKLLSSLLMAGNVKNALVFTRTKHGANKVAGDLQKSGITAAAIHGNKSQTARQQALSDFKSGRVKVLVATDIAARGLDIEELSHVFNYNLPDVPETYVHRIGRTGRAGHDGTAVSFCDINEKDELRGIEKLMGRAIPVVEDHPWPMEVFEPLPRDKKGRPVNPEDAEARAAAKERRRARDAAGKAAAEERKAEAAQKAQAAEPAPAPRKRGDRPAPAEQAPARKKCARGYRASATLEEALTATAPAQPARETGGKRGEEALHHTDPLAGDVIMDATARLLAPSPRMFQDKEHPRKGRETRRGKSSRPAGEESGQEKRPSRPRKEEKQVRPAQKKGVPAKALDVLGGGKKKRKGRGNGPGRPREVELRTDGVKDSTELSSSLMKPYYLSDD
ncbi:MAG: DEAD/DEAH box helicase [Clostridiales bacterium]|nr:DEAD/DEAH box helicase [Clostridiales bacterium]